MTTLGYLGQLNERLARSLAAASLPHRAEHAAFLAASQSASGSFPDRDGNPDLYYTAFALRALDILGALAEPLCQRAAGYLRQRLTQSASIVDFVSLLYSARLLEVRHGLRVFDNAREDWPTAVAGALESFRRPDGGYAKASRQAEGLGPKVQSPTRNDTSTLSGPALDSQLSTLDSPPPALNSQLSPLNSPSSTYHTFLVSLCYQMIGRPMPDPQAAARFVLSRRREDGGFVEIAPMRRSGTNPTAAAIAFLRLLDACSDEIRGGAVRFLADLQSPEGGLRANSRTPLADLLSTFTGLLTLADLGAADCLNLPAVRRYVESLACPTGGFRGGLWDTATDAEYTFYGLGTLALLHQVG